MLFRHITETAPCVTMDFSLLPKYCYIPYNAKLRSVLLHVQNTGPLSERFSSGENCIRSDVKNYAMMVQLISDKRHVHLNSRPRNIEASVQKDLSVGNNSICLSKAEESTKISICRPVLEKTKTHLQQISQTEARRSEEVRGKPEGKQPGALSSAPQEKLSDAISSAPSDVSDAESVPSHYLLVVKVQHHSRDPRDRKRKAIKPTAMKETWKLLDNALIRKTTSHPEKCSTDASSTPVHHEKKPLSSVCIPLELTMKDAADPRLTQSQQKKDTPKKVLDLPLPLFGIIMSQRPTGVVIGADRLTEPVDDVVDQQHTMRTHRMESYIRKLREKLDMLDDTKLNEFCHKLDNLFFQLEVDAEYHSSH